MALYRTVLDEGLMENLPRYANQSLLLRMCPDLRILVGRTVRGVWEDAYPEIPARTQTTT